MWDEETKNHLKNQPRTPNPPKLVQTTFAEISLWMGDLVRRGGKTKVSAKLQSTSLMSECQMVTMPLPNHFCAPWKSGMDEVPKQVSMPQSYIEPTSQSSEPLGRWCYYYYYYIIQDRFLSNVTLCMEIDWGSNFIFWCVFLGIIQYEDQVL